MGGLHIPAEKSREIAVLLPGVSFLKRSTLNWRLIFVPRGHRAQTLDRWCKSRLRERNCGLGPNHFTQFVRSPFQFYKCRSPILRHLCALSFPTRLRGRLPPLQALTFQFKWARLHLCEKLIDSSNSSLQVRFDRLCSVPPLPSTGQQKDGEDIDGDELEEEQAAAARDPVQSCGTDDVCWFLLPPEEGGEEEKPRETDDTLDPAGTAEPEDVEWRLAIYWERSTCKEIVKKRYIRMQYVCHLWSSAHWEHVFFAKNLHDDSTFRLWNLCREGGTIYVSCNFVAMASVF